MPSRSPWMKRRIFGFQRRVWWPKWTPASSSSRRSTLVSVAIEAPWVVLAVVPVRRRRGPGVIFAGQDPRALRAGSEVQERVSVEAMEMHPLAATGFADVADSYERGRPEYPAGVVALLGLEPGARVLDLAAGTGKLTRTLRAA